MELLLGFEEETYSRLLCKAVRDKMSLIDPLQQITSLFHFTDRRNIDLIRELGGLYPMATLRAKGVTIPAPGGNRWSMDADRARDMDRYVHLCFRSSHPMEFVARAEGRIGDTIFLSVHPEVMHWSGVRFTADVSNKTGVTVHTMKEAAGLIDFEVLYTRTDWKDPRIKTRLDQAEKCEILVPDFIPLKLIRNLPNG